MTHVPLAALPAAEIGSLPGEAKGVLRGRLWRDAGCVDGEVVTRHDVEGWWSDFAVGRCSAFEASEWAEQWLGGNWEELVIQGLLALQGVRHSNLPENALRKRMAAALAVWQQELRSYDADPDAWMRAYFTRMLIDFANRHGAERARAFGLKLVASGQLRDEDVGMALRDLQ
jgi:hypothetical protein